MESLCGPGDTAQFSDGHKNAQLVEGELHEGGTRFGPQLFAAQLRAPSTFVIPGINSVNSAAQIRRVTMPKTPAYLALQGAIDKKFQENLTPEEAFRLLLSGYNRFQHHLSHRRDRGDLIADAAVGQFPYAAVLGCIDSRVPVEEVFDAAFGDMFVARLAGNTVNNDVLGSLEYACKYAGAKVILVLGHTQCGAVRGAWDGLKDDHITGLLEHLQPAVDAVQSEKGTDPSPENLNACVHANVDHVIARIRQESATLQSMEARGEIAIAGAVYHVDKGMVDFCTLPQGLTLPLKQVS
jgi:carbonic anhydrase